MNNYSVLLASFDEHGKVDTDGILEVIRFNRERSKVDGLFVGGTGGEGFITDVETRKAILRLAKEHAPDFKLIASVGSSNYHEVLELSACAKELGYEAVGILIPQYVNLSFAEIRAYFQKLCPLIDMPVYVYHFPVLNRVVLDAAQFSELLSLPNVVGLKFTDTNFKLAEQLRRAHPNKTLLMGYDEFVSVSALIGFDGSIGISFNLIGAPISAIKSFVQAGDFAKAQRVQSHINTFLEQITPNTLQYMRMIINHYGYACRYSKLPLMPEIPHNPEIIKAYEHMLHAVSKV
ncbi:MAG: dihydrodipicolinate synthase family protein [Defluviitaleaceae bacterium]|nr:dihydrodipicolinate synthase family protein [Defluviitaleaceae bacterium]